MKTYRNSLRSERLIKEALISLLKEKDISKITVKDVTELADLSRNTFYAHYTDIYQVKEDIEKDITEKIVDYLDEFLKTYQVNDDTLPFFIKIMNFIEENKEIFTVLLNSNYNNDLIEELKLILINHTLEHTNRIRIKDYEGFILFLNILYSGVIDVLHQYLNGKTTHKNTELANKINEIFITTSKLYV